MTVVVTIDGKMHNLICNIYLNFYKNFKYIFFIFSEKKNVGEGDNYV